MATIFSRIVSGEIPAYKIAEDENYLAFLDIFPLAKGHTLVIPKKEVDYIFNMEDDLFEGLHRFSKKIAKALQKSVVCERIGVAVIGLEVPHAHIHLIPINNVNDINFSRPKLQFNKEEYEKIVADVKANLEM
jgi:histidine triad (HIT) family protein